MSPRRSTRSTPQKPQSLASKGKTRSNTARRRETYLDLDSEGEPTSSEDEAEEPRSKRAKRRHEQPVTPNKKNTRLNGIAPPTPELTPNRKHKGANGRKAPPVHVVQLPPTPTKTPTKPTKRRRPITEPTQETSLLDAPVEVEPASTETYRQSPQPEATPALPAARNTTSGQIVTSPGRVYSTESLRLLQSSILSKLRGYQPLISDTDKSPFLPCLESYEKDVRSSLERTVTEDEGNCTLLIGPRGVGKSTMVQHIIEGLREKHGADGFLLVKLNGLVHSTDRLALRDIARQLCASHLLQDGGAAVDDDGASFTSHASTLASLLAILEPPSGSTSATTSSKAIIFVLDEFDLFALRDARQSFLYCLLDIVQSHRRTGGMAVLGLSSRIDSLNMLEKRLKSRCQSRVLHVLSESVWTDIAKTGLRVGVDAILHQADVRDIDDVEDLPQLAADWNRSGVDAFLNIESVKTSLDDAASISSSKASIFSVLDQKVSDFQLSLHGSTVIDLQLRPRSTIAPQRIKRLLAGLSSSELTVLISLKHSMTESETFNLTMAQQTYRAHVKRQFHVQKGLGQGTFAKAFESLKAMGILVDQQGGAAAARGNAGLWRMARLVPWMQHVDQAVTNSSCSERLKRFCKSPDA